MADRVTMEARELASHRVEVGQVVLGPPSLARRSPQHNIDPVVPRNVAGMSGPRE